MVCIKHQVPLGDSHQGIISPVYLSISVKHQGKSPVWLSLSLWYLDDWCLSPVWLPAFIIRIKHQGIMSPVWLSAWPIPTWNPSLQPRCRHCPRSSLSPTRSQWYVYLRAKNKNFKLCILLTTVLKLAVLVGDGNKFLNMYIITCCWTLKNILRINHNNPINCFQLFSEQMYLGTFIFLKLFLQPDHFQVFHKIDGEQF